MRNIQLLVKKILELVQEIETYSFYKDNLERSLTKLFNDYQAGRYTYFEYEKAQKRFLKGKSKDEWINYYNAYLLSLMKRLEAYNSQIFYETYNSRDYEQIGKPKPEPKHLAKKVPVLAERPAKPEMPEFVHKEKPEIKARPAEKPVHVHEELMEAPPAVPAEPALVEVKPSLFEKISLFLKRLFTKHEVEKEIEELKKPPAPAPAVEKPKPAPAAPAHVAEKPGFWAWLFGTGKPKKRPVPVAVEPEVRHKPAPAVPPVHAAKKLGFWAWLFGTGKPKPKPKPVTPFAEKTEKRVAEKPETVSKGISWGHFFGIDYIRNILAKSRKVEFTDKKSPIPASTIRIETMRRRAKPEIRTQIEKITATSLTKEAHRIKNIMEQRKALKIYKPSFFGAVANLMIKRISLFLLDNFPDFFKDLYHALRLANIKVLSNTYVNMMVLGVLASTAAGLFLFGMFFSVTELPIEQMIFRTLMMSLLAGLAAFAGFYSYPYSKVKQRRRSINTNLPFAINHMAAVSSSGVAPVRMFKLISESKEYGEVSVEIEKIVNYIEIFGYDVLTSLKAVSSTTPSYHFKDFLEGMVSTTQTGGDIKAYFSQKAEEAMLNYKLERQKYTETISTYSDIYTGILIAAPLFFVAALSLVSLLGGKVGGMNVNVVIVIGTYVIIPFMNVAFLTFLQLTQPEI